MSKKEYRNEGIREREREREKGNSPARESAEKNTAPAKLAEMVGSG